MSFCSEAESYLTMDENLQNDDFYDDEFCKNHHFSDDEFSNNDNTNNTKKGYWEKTTNQRDDDRSEFVDCDAYGNLIFDYPNNDFDRQSSCNDTISVPDDEHEMSRYYFSLYYGNNWAEDVFIPENPIKQQINEIEKNPDMDLFNNSEHLFTEKELCNLAEKYCSDYNSYRLMIRAKKSNWEKTDLPKDLEKKELISVIENMFESDESSRNIMLSLIDNIQTFKKEIFKFKNFNNRSFDEDLYDLMNTNHTDKRDKQLDFYFKYPSIIKKCKTGYLIFKKAKEYLMDKQYISNGSDMFHETVIGDCVSDYDLKNLVIEFCKAKNMNVSEESAARNAMKIKTFFDE